MRQAFELNFHFRKVNDRVCCICDWNVSATTVVVFDVGVAVQRRICSYRSPSIKIEIVNKNTCTTARCCFPVLMDNILSIVFVRPLSLFIVQTDVIRTLFMYSNVCMQCTIIFMHDANGIQFMENCRLNKSCPVCVYRLHSVHLVAYRISCCVCFLYRRDDFSPLILTNDDFRQFEHVNNFFVCV